MPQCPLCGEEFDRNIRLKAYLGDYPLSIWECPECRLAFQSPQPTAQQSIDYMNWRYSSTDPRDVYITDRAGKLRICEDRLRWLREFSVPNKRILDVGSGNGAFVRASLDAGYDAVGFDFCPEAVSLAKRMFNVDTVQGSIDSVPDTPGYGVATLWDVIEHVSDPAATLRGVHARMKANGLLVIETCNWASPYRLRAGNAWSYYLYNHLYYFSPKSLRMLLIRSGFTDFCLHDGHNGDIIIATARRRG